MNPTSPQSQIPQQPQQTQQADPSEFGQYSDWARDNMSKGVSADALRQTLQSSGAQVQQPEKKGGGFADFLPTLGSIALPTIGALLAPVTGGTSLLASAALSGVGGALGETAKEAINGDNINGGDILGSGIQNAIGGGVGGVLGKLGGAILPKIGQGASKVADNLLMGQAPKGMLNQETANTLRNNFNVTNLSKAAPTIDAATGSTGALNQGVIKGLQEAADNGTVADLSGLNSTARDLVSQFQTQLKPGSIEQVNNVLKGANINAVNPEDVTKIAMKGGQVMTQPANGALKNVLPQDALDVTKNFESLAQTARNAAYDKFGNVVDADQLAKYKIFNGLAKESETQAFGGTNAIALSPENKADILQNLAPLKTENPQAYQHLSEQLDNISNLNELRSLQSPLVQASKALNAANIAENTSGGTKLGEVLPLGAGATGFTLGGPGGGIAGYALGKALESQPAAAMGTSVLTKLSNAVGSANAPKIVDTLARTGAITAANLPTMGAKATGNNNNPLSQGGQNMQGGQPQGQPSQGQPTSIDDLINLMITHPSIYGGQTGGLVQSLYPQMQKNALAQNQIASLQQPFEQAGGAQGIGGIGSVLSGLIPGTAANVYKQRSEAAAAQLAQTLGISPQAAAGLLPQLMQSPESAGGNTSVLSGLSGALSRI